MARAASKSAPREAAPAAGRGARARAARSGPAVEEGAAADWRRLATGRGAASGYDFSAHEGAHAEARSAAEADADRSAAAAVSALWDGSRAGGRLSAARPRLGSGLALHRCSKGAQEGAPATKVVGHGASAAAVKAAEERMVEVIGSLREPRAAELKGATVELHVIPQDKKLTDLPEFAHLRGTKTFDGRNYDDLRGVGGTKTGDTIRYAVAEEQVVTVAGKPSGYAQGFVAGHETGHIVEQFGLTADQKKDLQAAYDARKMAGGPWLSPDWYTSSGTGEYFAQATAAWFGRPYSESESDKTTYTRKWLEENDPAMSALLGKVYT